MPSDVQTYFRKQRRLLQQELRRFLRSQQPLFVRNRPWGPDAHRRLVSFLSRGKMVRGGLVLLGYEMAGRRPTTSTMRAGVAAELMHAALLIHDDIMDRDTERRNAPSLWVQYRTIGRRQADPDQFGMSMAINLGDLAFFLAFDALASSTADHRAVRELVQTASRELIGVGCGQMRDVASSGEPHPRSAAAVLALYRQKTARYSFSLPLGMGARLAAGSSQLRTRLDTLGETLGLMFQVRDDTIGLFGTRSEIGKPVGSDIRENKKTLFATFLFQRVRGEQRRRLERAFGNPRLTPVQIREVQHAIVTTGVRRDVERVMETLGRQAMTQIRALPVAPRWRTFLYDLVSYSRQRSS